MNAMLMVLLGELLERLRMSTERCLGEMVGICCGAQGSSKTLYRILYKGSRKRLPSLPTKVIKGAYRDCC